MNTTKKTGYDSQKRRKITVNYPAVKDTVTGITRTTSVTFTAVGMGLKDIMVG